MPRNHATVALSIGAVQGCFQTVHVARQSGGAAVSVSDPEILDWHAALARREGMFVEPTAAATLAAIARLRTDGTMRAGDSVVCLMTAGGLKDPGPMERELGPIPVVPADLDRALDRVAQEYGADLSSR